jgi:DNA-binding transcriptional ArsR family regulator
MSGQRREPGRGNPAPAPLVEWRHRLLEDPRPSKHAKSVWLALSVYWKPDGRDAWVGVLKLARQLDLSRSTVQRALQELRKLNLVEVEVRPGRTWVYHATGVFEPPPEPEVASPQPMGASQGQEGASQGSPTRVPGRPEVVTEEATEEAKEEVSWSSERTHEKCRIQESSLEEEELPSEEPLFEDEATQKYLDLFSPLAASRTSPGDLSADELLRLPEFRVWMGTRGHQHLGSAANFRNAVYLAFNVRGDVADEVRTLLGVEPEKER